MDFSALSAELQSIASRYNGPETDANVSTTMYCEMFHKILQKTETEVQEYSDQIVILWMTLSQLCNTATTLTACKARDGLYQDIFLQCAKTVLNIKWQNLSDDDQAKQNFIETVKATHSQLVTTGFNRFTLLLQLMENPWTDPTLSEIMSGNADGQDEAASEYISKEDHLILKLRVQMLVQENCEEFALNLATALLQHQLFKDDLELREKQLSLLHKQRLMDKLQEECEKIVCHDGVKLIRKLETKESNRSLCVRLVQLFLVQDWIKPEQNCCTQDLLKLWIRHQYIEDRDKETFLESVWAIAKLSSCTEQICSLVSGLQRECGNDLLQLFTDLCVYAVNVDKGCCEQQMLQGNMEGVRARQHSIAQTCRKLASLYSGVNPKISRISAITAFALDATLVNLCLVERMFNRKYCTHASGKMKECAACQKAFSSVTKCVSDVKVNPATLYEVERLLNMLRPYYLNPDMPWLQLLPVCQKFMKERVNSTSDAIALEVEKNESRVKTKTSPPKLKTKSTGTSTPGSRNYCDDTVAIVPKESVPRMKNKSPTLKLRPALPVSSTGQSQVFHMQKDSDKISHTATDQYGKAALSKHIHSQSTSLKPASAVLQATHPLVGQQVDNSGQPVIMTVPMFSEVATQNQPSPSVSVSSVHNPKCITVLSPASLQAQKTVYIKDPQSASRNARQNVNKPKKKSQQSIDLLEATKSTSAAKMYSLAKKQGQLQPTDGDLLRAARDYSLSMVAVSKVATALSNQVQSYTANDLLRSSKNIAGTNASSAQNTQSFQAAKDKLQATKAAFAASVLGIIPNSQSAMLTGANRNVLTSAELLGSAKDPSSNQGMPFIPPSLLRTSTTPQSRSVTPQHVFTDLLRATKSTPTATDATDLRKTQTQKRQPSQKRSRTKSPKHQTFTITTPINPDISMFKSKGIIPIVQANLEQYSKVVTINQPSVLTSESPTPSSTQSVHSAFTGGKKIPFNTTLPGEKLPATSSLTVSSSSNATSLSAVRPPSNSFQIPKNKDGSHRPRIIPIRTPSKSFPPYNTSELVLDHQPQLSTVNAGSLPSELYSMFVKEAQKPETIKKPAKTDPRRPSADELQSIVDWLQTGTEDDKSNPSTKVTSATVSSVVLNSVAPASSVFSSTSTQMVTSNSQVICSSQIPATQMVSLTTQQLNQLMLSQSNVPLPTGAGQLQQVVTTGQGVANIQPQHIQLIADSMDTSAVSIDQSSSAPNKPTSAWTSKALSGQACNVSSSTPPHGTTKLVGMQYLGQIKGASISDLSQTKNPKFILPNVSGTQMLGTVVTTQVNLISNSSKVQAGLRRASVGDVVPAQVSKLDVPKKTQKEKKEGTLADKSKSGAKLKGARRASLPTDLTSSLLSAKGVISPKTAKSASGSDLQVISKAKLIAALQSKFSSPQQLEEFSSKWPETVAVNMQLVASVVDRELKRRSEKEAKLASQVKKINVMSTQSADVNTPTTSSSSVSSVSFDHVSSSTGDNIVPVMSVADNSKAAAELTETGVGSKTELKTNESTENTETKSSNENLIVMTEQSTEEQVVTSTAKQNEDDAFKLYEYPKQILAGSYLESGDSAAVSTSSTSSHVDIENADKLIDPHLLPPERTGNLCNSVLEVVDHSLPQNHQVTSYTNHVTSNSAEECSIEQGSGVYEEVDPVVNDRFDSRESLDLGAESTQMNNREQLIESDITECHEIKRVMAPAAVSTSNECEVMDLSNADNLEKDVLDLSSNKNNDRAMEKTFKPGNQTTDFKEMETKTDAHLGLVQLCAGDDNRDLNVEEDILKYENQSESQQGMAEQNRKSQETDGAKTHEDEVNNTLLNNENIEEKSQYDNNSIITCDESDWTLVLEAETPMKQEEIAENKVTAELSLQEETLETKSEQLDFVMSDVDGHSQSIDSEQNVSLVTSSLENGNSEADLHNKEHSRQEESSITNVEENALKEDNIFTDEMHLVQATDDTKQGVKMGLDANVSQTLEENFTAKKLPNDTEKSEGSDEKANVACEGPVETEEPKCIELELQTEEKIEIEGTKVENDMAEQPLFSLPDKNNDKLRLEVADGIVDDQASGTDTGLAVCTYDGNQQNLSEDLEKKKTHETVSEKETAQEIELEKEITHEMESEKETAQEIELEKEITHETESEKETAHEIELENEMNQENESEKETTQEIELEKDITQETESEKETGKEIELEKEINQETESEKETVQEMESETERIRKTESEKETTQETESDKEKTQEIESEKEITQETESDKEKTQEIESEKEITWETKLEIETTLETKSEMETNRELKSKKERTRETKSPQVLSKKDDKDSNASVQWTCVEDVHPLDLNVRQTGTDSVSMVSDRLEDNQKDIKLTSSENVSNCAGKEVNEPIDRDSIQTESDFISNFSDKVDEKPMDMDIGLKERDSVSNFCDRVGGSDVVCDSVDENIADVSTDDGKTTETAKEKEKLFAFGFGSDDDEYLATADSKKKEQSVTVIPSTSEANTVNIVTDQSLADTETIPFDTETVPDVTMDIFSSQFNSSTEAIHSLLEVQNITEQKERKFLERQDSGESNVSWISNSSGKSSKSWKRSAESDDSGTKILSLQKHTSHDVDGIRLEFFGPQSSRKDAKYIGGRSQPKQQVSPLSSTNSSYAKLPKPDLNPVVKNELIAVRPLQKKVKVKPAAKFKPKQAAPPEEAFTKKNMNKCIICSKTFKSVESLKCHIRNICRSSSVSKDEKTLLGVFEYKSLYRCMNCETEFESKEDLNIHIAGCCSDTSMNSCSVSFKCKMCGEVFSSKEKIHEHVSRLCGNIQTYKQQKQDRLEHKEEVVKNIDKQWLEITGSKGSSIEERKKPKDEKDENCTSEKQHAKEKQDENLSTEQVCMKERQESENFTSEGSRESKLKSSVMETKIKTEDISEASKMDQDPVDFSQSSEKSIEKVQEQIKRENSDSGEDIKMNIQKSQTKSTSKNNEKSANNCEIKNKFLSNKGFEFFSTKFRPSKKTASNKKEKRAKAARVSKVKKNADIHPRNNSVKGEAKRSRGRPRKSEIKVEITEEMKNPSESLSSRELTDQETGHSWDVEQHRKELKALRKYEKSEMHPAISRKRDNVSDFSKVSDEKSQEKSLHSKKDEIENEAKKQKLVQDKVKMEDSKKSQLVLGKRVITKAKKFMDDEYVMPEMFKTQVATSNIKRQFKSKRMINSQTTSLLKSREFVKGKGNSGCDVKQSNNSLSGNEKTDRCPKCGQTFKNIYSLTQHIARIHLSPYKTTFNKKSRKVVYRCKFCSRMFSTFNMFCNHIQSHRDKVFDLVSKSADDVSGKKSSRLAKRIKNLESKRKRHQSKSDVKRSKPCHSKGDENEETGSKKTCVISPVCLETRSSKYQRREVDSVSVSSNDKEDDATSTGSQQVHRRSRSSIGSNQQETSRRSRQMQRGTSEDRDSFTSEDSLIHKHFTRRQLEKFDLLKSRDQHCHLSMNVEKSSTKKRKLDRKRDDMSVTSDESWSERQTRYSQILGSRTVTRHQKQSSWEKDSLTSEDSTYQYEKRRKESNKEGDSVTSVETQVTRTQKQLVDASKNVTKDKLDNKISTGQMQSVNNEAEFQSGNKDSNSSLKRKRRLDGYSNDDKTKDKSKAKVESLKHKLPRNEINSPTKKQKTASKTATTSEGNHGDKIKTGDSVKMKDSSKTYRLRNTPSHQQARASSRITLDNVRKTIKSPSSGNESDGNAPKVNKPNRQLKSDVRNSSKELLDKGEEENMADVESEDEQPTGVFTRRRSDRLNAGGTVPGSKSIASVIKHSKKLKNKYEKYSRLKVSLKRLEIDPQIWNKKCQLAVKSEPDKKNSDQQKNGEKATPLSNDGIEGSRSSAVTAVEEDDEFAFVKSPSAKIVNESSAEDKRSSFKSKSSSSSEFLDSFKSYIGNRKPSPSPPSSPSPPPSDRNNVLKSLKGSTMKRKVMEGKEKTNKFSRKQNRTTEKDQVDSDSDNEVVFMNKIKVESPEKMMHSKLGSSSRVKSRKLNQKKQVDCETIKCDKGQLSNHKEQDSKISQNVDDSTGKEKKPSTFLDSFIAYHSSPPRKVHGLSSDSSTPVVSKSANKSSSAKTSSGSNRKVIECKQENSKQNDTLHSSESSMKSKRKSHSRNNSIVSVDLSDSEKLVDLKNSVDNKRLAKDSNIQEKMSKHLSTRKTRKSVEETFSRTKHSRHEKLCEKHDKQLGKNDRRQNEKGSSRAATHSPHSTGTEDVTRTEKNTRHEPSTRREPSTRSEQSTRSEEENFDDDSIKEKSRVNIQPKESQELDSKRSNKDLNPLDPKDKGNDSATVRPTSFESLQTYIDSMSNSPITVIDSPSSEKPGSKPETKMSQAFMSSFQDSFMTYLGSGNKSFGKVCGSSSSSECGDIKSQKAQLSDSGQSKPFTWDMDSGDEETKSVGAKSVLGEGNESGTSARKQVERGVPTSKIKSKTDKVRHLYHEGKIWQIGKGSVTSVPVLPSETESMGSGRSVGRDSPVSVLSDFSDYSRELVTTSSPRVSVHACADTWTVSPSSTVTSSSTSSQGSTSVCKYEQQSSGAGTYNFSCKSDGETSRKCDSQNVPSTQKKRDKHEHQSHSAASSKIELIVVDRKLDSDGFCLLKADDKEYDKLNTYTSLASTKDLKQKAGNKNSKWKVQTGKKPRTSNSKEFPFVFKKSRRT